MNWKPGKAGKETLPSHSNGVMTFFFFFSYALSYCLYYEVHNDDIINGFGKLSITKIIIVVTDLYFRESSIDMLCSQISYEQVLSLVVNLMHMDFHLLFVMWNNWLVSRLRCMKWLAKIGLHLQASCLVVFKW